MTTRSCIPHDPLTDAPHGFLKLMVLSPPQLRASLESMGRGRGRSRPAAIRPGPGHLLTYFFFFRARNEIPERIAFC
jgi:hypothetical protein